MSRRKATSILLTVSTYKSLCRWSLRPYSLSFKFLFLLIAMELAAYFSSKCKSVTVIGSGRTKYPFEKLIIIKSRSFSVANSDEGVWYEFLKIIHDFIRFLRYNPAWL